MSWTTFILRVNFSVWLIARRWMYRPLRKPTLTRSHSHRVATSLHSDMARPVNRSWALTEARVSMAARSRRRSIWRR